MKPTSEADTFLKNFRVDFYPPRIIRANHGSRWVAGLPYGMVAMPTMGCCIASISLWDGSELSRL